MGDGAWCWLDGTHQMSSAAAAAAVISVISARQDIQTDTCRHVSAHCFTDVCVCVCRPFVVLRPTTLGLQVLSPAFNTQLTHPLCLRHVSRDVVAADHVPRDVTRCSSHHVVTSRPTNRFVDDFLFSLQPTRPIMQRHITCTVKISVHQRPALSVRGPNY